MPTAEERFATAARERGLDLCTPPFGYPRALAVVLDEDLLDHDVVWAAAGSPRAVFPTDPTALRDAADAAVADIAER